MFFFSFFFLNIIVFKDILSYLKVRHRGKGRVREKFSFPLRYTPDGTMAKDGAGQHPNARSLVWVFDVDSSGPNIWGIFQLSQALVRELNQKFHSWTMNWYPCVIMVSGFASNAIMLDPNFLNYFFGYILELLKIYLKNSFREIWRNGERALHPLVYFPSGSSCGAYTRINISPTG